MGVKMEVHVYEVEPIEGRVQTFCAETKIDHIPENNVKGYGRTPEDALEAWVEEIKEHEIFRPD